MRDKASDSTSTRKKSSQLGITKPSNIGFAVLNSSNADSVVVRFLGHGVSVCVFQHGIK